MRMNWVVISVVAVLAVALALPAAQAAGNKYGKSPKVIQAEKDKSLSDCNAFAASFKSKGKAADNAEFKKQYGDAANASKAVTEYNYDKYTKIALKCAKKACNASCLQK